MKKNIIFVMLITLLIFANQREAFAFGSVEEADITYPIQVYYLSPANQDGVNDKIELSFTGNITPPKRRKLEKVIFALYDNKGELVFQKEDDFTSITSYSFDGKDSNGKLLPDGSYVYTIGTVDNKGNISTSQPYPIVIDNTPPDIMSAKFLSGNIASFNGGIATSIEVLGSREVLWTYYAKGDGGSEYIIFQQESDTPTAPPESWDWTAISSDGKVIEDDFYAIKIEAKDLAGNITSQSIPVKVIVTQDDAVRISLESENDSPFSPNQDKIKDELPIHVAFPSNGSITSESYRNWSFVVQDSNKQEIVNIPIISMGEHINFAGRDTSGIAIEDGDYSLHLKFGNEENHFISNSIDFTIDNTYPKASVFLNTSPEPIRDGDPLYFGGEKRQKIVGSFKALENLQWNIAIYKEVNGNREQLYDKPIKLSADNTYPVDIGDDFSLNEAKLSDGFYTIDFYAIDAAGNRGGITDVSFVKDTEEKLLSVVTNKDTVSPFGPPVNFIIDYSKEGIKDFSIDIENKGGRNVFGKKERNRGIYNIEWNAKGNDGNPVVDGDYNYAVNISYYNGEDLNAEGRIVVDTIPPEITEFKFSSELINPKDAQTRNNKLEVTQTTNANDAEWVVEIKNIFEQSVYYEEQGAVLENVAWDGKDSKGNIVPDGDYIYILVGRDLAGNTVERNVSFIVDTGQYNSGNILSIDDDMPFIFFPAYSQDIFSYGEDKLLYENLLNIRSVARLLKAYPNYNLKIIGHAAALLKGTPRESKEQTEVLMPLSKARAEQIRRAILILGIEEDRITVEAVGGKDPLISEPTKNNIWQNRRVVFELVEK